MQSGWAKSLENTEPVHWSSTRMKSTLLLLNLRVNSQPQLLVVVATQEAVKLKKAAFCAQGGLNQQTGTWRLEGLQLGTQHSELHRALPVF